MTQGWSRQTWAADVHVAVAVKVHDHAYVYVYVYVWRSPGPCNAPQRVAPAVSAVIPSRSAVLFCRG
ncbi:MAG: hypothetical protein HYY06_32115 [Deltaproteobacteria bacterium]|nr:hypothetical protein [Deltaproteobacteria bacterium]